MEILFVPGYLLLVNVNDSATDWNGWVTDGYLLLPTNHPTYLLNQKEAKFNPVIAHFPIDGSEKKNNLPTISVNSDLQFVIQKYYMNPAKLKIKLAEIHAKTDASIANINFSAILKDYHEAVIKAVDDEYNRYLNEVVWEKAKQIHNK